MATIYNKPALSLDQHLALLIISRMRGKGIGSGRDITWRGALLQPGLQSAQRMLER